MNDGRCESEPADGRSPLPEEADNKVVDLTSRALRRRSLHERVAEILRELILEGDLKPGERIVELDLCRKLNVSRTPMREALKVLTTEQLVELQPGRGTVVTSIRIEEVTEHFEVLEVLEAMIGELVAARISNTELRSIDVLHHEMIEHLHAGRRAKYFETNQAVHAKLAAATGNKNLVSTHLQYSRKIARVRYAANFSQICWEESAEEHGKIIAALHRRDGAELSRLMREHMRVTGRRVIAVLEHDFERRAVRR